MNDEHYPKISLKSLSWEEYALVFAILISAIVYAIHISEFNQIPSPIYGGDFYRDRGFIKNIVAGNPVWSDGFYANEIQYYPYMIFALQAGFVMLTGADIDKTFLYTPLIVLIISTIAWYMLGLRIFRSRKWALLTGLAYLGTIYFYFPKSAGIALLFTVPMFIYYWIRYEQEDKLWDAVLAGVMLGLTSLIWGGVFIGMFLTSALVIIYYFIKETASILLNNKHDKPKALFGLIVKFIKKYYVIFAVTILISLIFFLPLILKYHLNEVNAVTKWGDSKIELLGIPWILYNLKYMFFDTTNATTFIVGIISLLGIFGMIFSKRKKESEFIFALILCNIIVLEHHLITRPLLNWSFLPQKMIYYIYFVPILFVYGIMAIYTFIKNDKARWAVFGLSILLLVFSFGHKYNVMINEDPWDKVGRGDATYTKALYGLGDFLEKNMAKDETVLSNDESGFMLAVVSGRKVMLTRRTHASYYVDIDQRIADASVAMYGSDTELALSILKKYNVEYFYLDQQFFQNVMRVRTDLKPYLEEHGILFQEAYDRYDIALPPEQANMMNLLIIPPQNISQGFINLWSKVYTVQAGGQIVGELYRLNQ
jgi:hypothetical protein